MNTELPSNADVYNYRYVFTGRKRGALGVDTVRVELTFQAPQYLADERAWTELLDSGAYDTAAHFSPIVRERVSAVRT